MKKLAVIFLLPLTALGINLVDPANQFQNFELLNPGLSGAAQFGDGNKLVVGNTGADGSFNGIQVAPSDFFNGMVYQLDSNSFSVYGSTVYTKGLVQGGTVVAINTNLAGVFAHFSFATNSRVIIGAVPSFAGATLAGQYSGVTGINFPTYPTLQASTDGGTTWTAGNTNVPVLISIYDASGNADGATNLTVLSYVNPATLQATNDFGGQVIYLDLRDTSSRSVPNIGYVNFAASAASQSAAMNWAKSPAVATVNLAGQTLALNSSWTVTTVSNMVQFLAGGAAVMTLTPGVNSGALPSFLSLSVTATNVLFKLSASVAPSVQLSTNLGASAWISLAGQTNWFNAGSWFVSAPLPTNPAAFFRASIAGTNVTPATVTFNAAVNAGGVTTNLQFTFGTARTNTLYFTNGILMKVSQP